MLFLIEMPPSKRMAMVTIGTDGFVDYVQVPDGHKYMLGPVSVLRLITGVAKSNRCARIALEEFVANGKTLLSVDLDRMWELLPFKRARYSSASQPIVNWDNDSRVAKMKTDSYDTLVSHVELAEKILFKIADTDTSIDRWTAAGKRFDAVRAKSDLLRIASRVDEIARNVNLAQKCVGKDLAQLSAQAEGLRLLFCG